MVSTYVVWWKRARGVVYDLSRKLLTQGNCGGGGNVPRFYTVMFVQSHANYAYALIQYISQLVSILIGSCCP